MIDPSKDKFAYFKDNIQTAEDKVRPSSPRVQLERALSHARMNTTMVLASIELGL